MLIVDCNEKEEKIFKILKKMNQPYKVQKMLLGDYTWEGKDDIVIERKSFVDFLVSYTSGHLMEQLENLEKNYDKYFLFITNVRDDSFKNLYFNKNLPKHIRRLTEDSFNNMIIHIYTSFSGVRILKFSNELQFVKTVVEFFSYKGSKRQKEIIRRVQSKEDVYLSLLCCVNGISIEKAKSIKNEYPIFSMFMDALRTDMFSVKGIGEKLLSNLNDAFCDEKP